MLCQPALKLRDLREILNRPMLDFSQVQSERHFLLRNDQGILATALRVI